MIELLHPWFLLLALAAPLAWFVPRRATDSRHAAIRSALIVLLAAALARPVRIAAEDVERRVVVLDASPSVAPADAEVARSAALALSTGKDARTTWIEVASSARGGSSLSLALERAARAFPPEARGSVVLFTDGRGTDPHAARAVETLVERGLPVHVVPLAVAAPLAVTGVDARGPLVAGQTARVLCTLAGSAEDVDVTLSVEGAAPASRARVSVDGRTAVELTFEAPRADRVRVTVEAIDRTAGAAATSALTEDGGPRRWTRTWAVQEPLRVLYAGGRVEGSAARLAAAIGEGFEVVEADLTTGEGGSRLDRFDVVVIDDRPAELLPDAFLRELERAVSDRGVGLLACGGRAAFGPGGWDETPLAALLPVEARQKEEKRDPSTTLVVIIDTSGSMGGNRVQLAKEVARLAIRRLLPHDKVGIVEFYGAKRWAAPIQPASNSIEIQRALNRLDAGGGTVILPAIEEAFYGLQNVRTRYKHVLILTDGGVERGAFEPLLRRMADKGMNVSTVLIGPDAHSEFLVSLAQWGKGRFYSVPNRFNLPEILLKQPTSARLPAYRPGTHAVRARAGRAFLGDVAVESAPPLSGYVETRLAPGASAVLETVEAGHPVLATRPAGAGVVTAFTSEPTGEGTASWRDWPEAGRLFARALARTAGRASRPFDVTASRRDHEVTCRARRRLLGDARPAPLVVEGRAEAVPFDERADGVFEARFVAPPDQELLLEVGVDGEPEAAVTRVFLEARSDVRPEEQVDPADALHLARLASATGGLVVPLAEAAAFVPSSGGGAGALRLVELRPLFALLALLVWLLDVTWRRLPRRVPDAAVGGRS